MDISHHILSCIINLKTASVPDFGTFSAQYHSARLVKNGQVSFIPPKRTVDFSQTQGNDALFIRYIAYKLAVSEDEARQAIAEFVASGKQSLQNGEDFTIDKVGTIHPDWSFESHIAEESFHDSYGLMEFSMDTLTDAEKKNAKGKPTRIAKNAAKALIISSPILFGALLIPNILHVAQNETLASLLRNTVATIDSSKPEIPRPQNFDSSSEETQEIAVAETKPIEPAEHTILQEESNEPQESTPVEQEAEQKYYVIVGTFSVKENAERMQKKLKQKAYDSGVITESNKSRVYVSAFSNADDAQQCVQKLHAESEYGNAWVYVKNT